MKKWVGSEFTACIRIYTGAALCDGQGRPPEEMRRVLVTIRECVSWVCEDALWEHE